MYTTGYCPYCVMAKNLLQQRQIAYDEIRIDGFTSDEREALCRKNKMYTVPQIVLDGEKVIGGFDELAALDRQNGGLDSLA